MKELTVELMKVLNDFVDEEKEIIEKEMKKVAQETAAYLREISPKRPSGGAYAQGWRLKNVSEKNVVHYSVHNAKHGSLTYLLEKGHQTYNQYGGPYKRTPAHVHIEKAENFGSRLIVERLKAKL